MTGHEQWQDYLNQKIKPALDQPKDITQLNGLNQKILNFLIQKKRCNQTQSEGSFFLKVWIRIKNKIKQTVPANNFLIFDSDLAAICCSALMRNPTTCRPPERKSSDRYR